MSESIVSVLMDRISAATPESPIAVFGCAIEGKLNGVFANTAWSVGLIRAGRGLVGVFDKTMDAAEVKMVLMRAVRGAVNHV